MNRPDKGQRFVGTTSECLRHLYSDLTRKQRLALNRLLVNFCGAESHSALRWQANPNSLGSTNLLRVRCFLHLAGYEVHELDGLPENIRFLALMLGLGVLKDPYEVQRTVGFTTSKKDLNSLNRIILYNKGTTPETYGLIDQIVDRHRAMLQAALDSKREQLQVDLDAVERGELPARPDTQADGAKPAPASPPEPADGRNVTAFWRAIGLTVSLGLPIVGDPDARALVRTLSNGSPELYELRDVLNTLLEEQ